MTKTLSARMSRQAVLAWAVFLALLGALAQTAWAMPMGGPGEHGAAMMGPMGGRMMGRMLDAVNATPEQRSRIEGIVKAAREDLRSQRQAARGLREQAMQIFTQPTVDARAAEALRQQMLAQHDQASKRMMQAMLDISAVLTPAQRAQLAEQMQKRREMMQRHQREREALDPPRR